MRNELVLLPAPRRITRARNLHRLQPGRYVWIDSAVPALQTGRILQQALAVAGVPAELTASGGSRAEALAVRVHVREHLFAHAQGYRLTIDPTAIRIVAHDAAGAFYAAQTLLQIARQSASAGCLPCVRIEDWPDFPSRGVMLDISRDKVPTMATLYGLVDLLAEWKVNQFQLYTEHTFAYRNHRVVWEKASPMTGAEILALDAYCRERFVELVPNQNSFGHMNRWLTHPPYQPLAETPNGFDTPWGTRHTEPFSLCPTDPRSLALMAELYDEILPHFSSRMINIGCDETWDVGQGRSKAACEQRGKGRVYLDFLLQLHRLIQGHGHTMQFWGDIIMQHPELIPELPRDLIALEWGYEANHPFAKDGRKFAAAGVPFYVCPGTSSWNSLTGRTENALGNLWSAAENGLRYGAIGFLNTDWGDNGHWQTWPIPFLGYAYGAAVSWAAAANRKLDLAAALDQHAFHDASGILGRLAYDLGNVYKTPGVLVGNNSVLHWLLLNPQESLDKEWLAGLNVPALANTQSAVAQILKPLGKARPDRPDATLIADEFRVNAAMLAHACRLGMARKKASGNAVTRIPARTRQALAEDLRAIIAEHKRLWLARNRPGGLPESVGRLTKLLALYEQAG